MYFKRFAQWSLFLSVAVLFNKTIAPFGIKLDMLFLALSASLLAVAVLRRDVVIEWKKILPYLTASALIITATVIGSAFSFSIFGSLPIDQILIEYRILFGCLLIFFEVLILGMHDNAFLKNLVYAFLASLIVAVTPYVPIDFIQHSIGAQQHRFFGFIGDANYYPTFMMIPTALVGYLLLKELQRNKISWRGISLYVLLSLIVGLTWWSGSRSGWLGIIIEIFILLLIGVRASSAKIKTFFSYLLIFASVIITGYFILPSNAKSDIGTRLGYITTPEQVIRGNITGSDPLERPLQNTPDGTPLLPSGDNSIKTIPLIDAVSYNQDRVYIWLQGIHFFMQNPAGYGLVYYNQINIKSAENHVSVHSFILETLLIGGPLLFFVMIYFIASVSYSFIVYKKKNFDIDLESVLFTAMLGFLGCSLFLSSLLLRWFWIDLAILLALQMNRGSYNALFTLRNKPLLDNNSQTLEK